MGMILLFFVQKIYALYTLTAYSNKPADLFGKSVQGGQSWKLENFL